MSDSVVVDKELWKCYSQTRDVKLRNEIVMKYTRLVKGLVFKMRGAYNDVEMEDVVNHGMMTLIDCVERFDFTREVKFETFASIRIRGNVIDYLRQQDWVPRRLRREAKQVEKAFVDLKCSETENLEGKVAEYLGITVENVRKIISEISRFHIISYEELVYGALEGNQVEFQDTTGFGSPDEELLKKEFAQQLTELISKLLEREKLILALYYSERLKFKEIANILEVTESRICQIHGRTLKKLKEGLIVYLK